MKTTLILFLVFTAISCNERTWSSDGGLKVDEMIPSKRGIYSSKDQRILKSWSIFSRNRFYAVVRSTEKENYNWLYLVNDTDKWVGIDCEDGQPKFIQEALNQQGVWLPIEYWVYSTCSFSFNACVLRPKEYAYYKIHKYNGDFYTKMRVKIIIKGKLLYSKVFMGMINEEQFEKPPKVVERQFLNDFHEKY